MTSYASSRGFLSDWPQQEQRYKGYWTSSLPTFQVEHYLDYIVCTGRSQREYDDRFRLIMKRLREADVTINMEKFMFSKPETEYCSYHVSKQDVRSTPAVSHPAYFGRTTSSRHEGVMQFLPTVRVIFQFHP